MGGREERGERRRGEGGEEIEREGKVRASWYSRFSIPPRQGAAMSVRWRPSASCSHPVCPWPIRMSTCAPSAGGGSRLSRASVSTSGWRTRLLLLV